MCVLDDRPVRDCERKASLLNFTTDHAYELKKCAFVPKVAEPGRYERNKGSNEICDNYSWVSMVQRPSLGLVLLQADLLC